MRGLGLSVFRCPGALLRRCMRQSARERAPDSATAEVPFGSRGMRDGREGGVLEMKRKG